MNEIELILEIPAAESSEAELPAADLLPRVGAPARVAGLDGQQCLQVGVLVGLGSIRVLRTWLLARAERLKKTRVLWQGQTFEGYSPREIERLIALLQEGRSEGEGSAGPAQADQAAESSE
jgi:hypothetical protein